MLAVVFDKAGGPEELRVAEVPDPVPGDQEVVIDVHATALNRADLLQRRGLYAPPPGASPLLGLECAGVVREVGPYVATTRVGERVMALLPGGGYAERAVVHERSCLPIPKQLTFEEAAAVPEAFLAASEMLFHVGRAATDELVLIHAAGSGVGTAAIQLAREAGLHTIGTTSAGKVARVRELGAERVVARDQEDFAAAVAECSGGRGVDVIVDLVGAAYAEKNQRCLAVRGRHVIAGLMGGAKVEVDFGQLLRKRQSLLGFILRPQTAGEKAGVVERFRARWLGHLERGALRPIVDCVLPLSAASRAHAQMEANESFGKIVLSVR
jgi:putative PIG3 family NAD(P)H quinone oxidoreductase